ncbi:hypothetical protein ACXC9Q_02780 [Kribbella sp. CWNU-51]
MSGRWILLHLDGFVAPVAIVGLVLLSGHADVSGAAGDTFTAAMTVLVFLLPSTSLLGGYLTNAIDTTSRLLARAKDDSTRLRRAEAARDQIDRLLEVAGPLHRAIVYTTLAVLLSSVALFDPGGRWRDFTVTEVLIAVSVSLLAGTALTVLPATWTVLEYRQARDYLDRDLITLSEPGPTPAAPPPATPTPPADPGRRWSLNLELKGPPRP